MHDSTNPKYNLQWKLSELKRLQKTQSMLNSEIKTVRAEIKELRPFAFNRFFCLSK